MPDPHSDARGRGRNERGAERAASRLAVVGSVAAPADDGGGDRGPLLGGAVLSLLVFCSGLDRLRHMSLRRYAACLLSLTMLQLGMVRAEICAAHTDIAATGGDATHHGNHDTPDSAPEPDCDAPTGADCCTGVASCSLVLTTPEAISGDVPVLEHVALVATPRGAPISATAAPETPPPRV